MKTHLTILIFLILFIPQIRAQEEQQTPDSAQQAEYALLDSLANSIKFQEGTFILLDNLATVNTAGGFAYFDKKDANILLSKLWSNPEDPDVLGMLVPADLAPLDDNFWGVIFSYSDDGHVKDDDAADIKYDELLESMKQSTEEENAERIKGGYSALHLVGWAQPPFYDKAQHKLHWAKDILTGKDSLHTLNYNIRMLGRKGVLVMNVVASIEQLPMIKQKSEKIMASTNFTQGNRYEDYVEGMDKVAEYGIATLIAGGVLAKTGLLAKLGIFLVKAWKVIALAVVGGLAAIKKYFNKTKKGSDENPVA
jgi:uncharacterized membrane-anchored protein